MDDFIAKSLLIIKYLFKIMRDNSFLTVNDLNMLEFL